MSDQEEYYYYKLGFVQATRARVFDKETSPPDFIDEIVLGFYDARDDSYKPDGVSTKNIRGIISITWKEKLIDSAYWVTLEIPDTSWYLMKAYIPILSMLSELDLGESTISPEEICELLTEADIPDITDEDK